MKHNNVPSFVYRIGVASAWLLTGICVLYVYVLLAGGVIQGLPREPYFALAEGITILSAIVLVTLMAVIHQSTPEERRLFSVLGLGWMLVMAAITSTVHIVELSVGRQLDAASRQALARIFDFEWPSLLYAVEFVAWHLGLGLSLCFGALAFSNEGLARWVRRGFMVTGLLCLVGLVGPILGNMALRLIGVFSYTMLLPAVCVILARYWRGLLLS